MSHLPANYVKRGMWVDHEGGPIFGRVITTDSGTGTLVVAILAVMTAFGTTHLWNLLAFSYHQSRVNSRPTDGLFRQQQASLRTLPTPSSLVSDWLKLWWTWRYRARNPLLRSLPQLLLGTLFTVATVAISLSTSYIVSTSDVKVLVESPLCGPLENITERFDAQTNLAGTEYYSNLSPAALSYVDDCYSDSNYSTVSGRCAAFIQPNIRFRTERVHCPFGGSICSKMEMPGISFDSGLLDLNTAFGLNLPQRNRVKYRRRTTCALLNIDGHYSVVNSTKTTYSGHDQLWQVYFAKEKDKPTVAISIGKSNVTDYFRVALRMKYGASVYSNFTTIDPLAEMTSDNSDFTLIIIIPNAVTYERPVNDPLFSAHRANRVSSTSGGNFTVYNSDYPFSAVGCQVQHQYCYSHSSGQDLCTELSHLPGPITPEEYPGASDTQLSALSVLVQTSKAFDIEFTATKLKASALKWTEGIIPNLPDNQWILELTNWESMVWAAMQMSIADFSIGIAARVPTAAAFQKKSVSAGDKRLCQMQRMKNPGGFVNISVFGLAFTLTFCCLIIAVDIILLKFLIFLKRFRKAFAPRIDAWIQDGTYQLQRRAYEAHGEGDWERLDEEIPLTHSGQKVGRLPIESLPAAFPLPVIYHQCICQTSKMESNSLPTLWTERSLEIKESPAQPSTPIGQFADQNLEKQSPFIQTIAYTIHPADDTDLLVSPIVTIGSGPPEIPQLNIGPEQASSISVPSMSCFSMD